MLKKTLSSELSVLQYNVHGIVRHLHTARYLYPLAVRCPEILDRAYLSKSSDDISYNTDVTLTCDAPSYFPNAVRLIWITCGSDGQWSSEIPKCEGNSAALIVIIMILDHIQLCQ